MRPRIAQAARRLFGRLLWSLLAIVLAVLAIVAVLLTTNAGLRLLVRIGLNTYNDRIDGSAAVAVVEGRLLDRFVLRGVALRDRDGDPLITVDAITVEWSPWPLLRGNVVVHELLIEGPRVHVTDFGGRASAFGDLAPPTMSDPDPSALPGPDLPIGLDVALSLRDAAVVGAGDRAIVAEAGLDAHVLAAGQVARLDVSHAHARLPGAPELRDLDTRIRWSSPTLIIDELRAHADAAELGASGRVDVEALDGDLRLRARADLRAFSELLPAAAVEPLRALGDRAALAVDVRGGPEETTATLDLDLGRRLTIGFVGAGGWRADPWVDGRLRGELDLGPWTGGKLGSVAPTLTLRGRALADNRQAFAAILRCSNCDGLGPVTGDLRGIADPERETLSLAAELTAAGVGVAARLRTLGGELQRLRWQLEVSELARPAAVARSLVALPQLRGALSGQGMCTGAPLRCAGAVEARRLAVDDVAVRSLRLDAHVRPGGPSGSAGLRLSGLRVAGESFAALDMSLDVEPAGTEPVVDPPLAALAGIAPMKLDIAGAARHEQGDRAALDLSLTTGDVIRARLGALELTYRRLRVAALDPALFVLRRRSLRIDGLHLAVADGRLRVDGVADLDGPSDLRAELASLSLAALRPFLPARLRPAGLVSATLHLRGRPEVPSLRAALALQRLTLAGGPLGDLGLALRVQDGRGDLVLATRSPLVRRATLDASLPLRVNLADRTWSIDPGAARVELRVRRLDLFHATPWLPDLLPSGRVDGFFLLDGRFGGDDSPLSSPRIVSEWQGRGVRLARVPLGDLDLDLYHRGEWLRGVVDLHRRRGRARLDFQAPLSLDLRRRTIAWDRSRDHRGLLRVTGVELGRQLAGRTPGRDLHGKVEARVELFGPATAPQVSAEVRARDIVYRGLALGSGTLRATMDRGSTQLRLAAGSGLVGRLWVHTQVPIAVGVDGVDWRRDGWYVAEVDLDDVDLGVVERLTGVHLRGRVTTDLAFDGAGRDSRISGSLQVDDFEHNGDPIGRFGAEFSFRESSVRLQGRGQLGRDTYLRLDARLPIDLDLASAEVAWRRERPTAVSLDVTGIDGEVLKPLVTLAPDAVREMNLELRGELDREHVRGYANVAGELGDPGLPRTLMSAQIVVNDEHQTLRARVGDRSDPSRLTLTGSTALSLPALMRGEGDVLAAPIEGKLVTRGIDMRSFSGLLPQSLYELTGTLVAKLELAGRLGRPAAYGAVRVRRGGVVVVPLQQRFRDLEVDVMASGRSVRVERIAATSGRGSVSASGSARFKGDGKITADAELVSQRFPVVRPGLPQMTIDTRVRADVRSAPDELAVDLAIRGTEVWVSDFTTRAPKPIPENENVELITGPLDALRTTVGERPVADAPAGMGEDRGVTRVSVDLREPVHIQGPTMDMRWDGRITARIAGDETRTSGSFRTDRGRFELLGNQFRIDEGRVFLPASSGTLDPYLDLTARTSTGGHDVTVDLRGRLSRPELRLRSEPPLNESQIFALLVTGTVDASESDPRKTEASAAGLLLNFSSPTLSRFADQRLGIDRIKLGFADDISQPVLTIGKHITRSLYAETTYHHNAPPRQNRVELSIEYYFTPRWMLETTYGDAAVGSVDVFWRHVFGLKRPMATLPAPGAPSPSYSPAPSPAP